jgi:hypothetical protein
VNFGVMLQISAAGHGYLSYAHCIVKHRLFGCVLPIPTRQHQTKVTASRCDQPTPAAVLWDWSNEELCRRGFSPQELAEHRPGTTYCSVRGYVYDGLWANRAGFDMEDRDKLA